MKWLLFPFRMLGMGILIYFLYQTALYIFVIVGICYLLGHLLMWEKPDMSLGEWFLFCFVDFGWLNG